MRRKTNLIALDAIANEKQRLQEQVERGRLLIENAQLKFQRLVEKEKTITEMLPIPRVR